MHGDTMMLVHTEVPPQLEGRGFASMLVRAAFDYARENGLDVLPVCSFVSAWARRHPEVEPLLAVLRSHRREDLSALPLQDVRVAPLRAVVEEVLGETVVVRRR